MSFNFLSFCNNDRDTTTYGAGKAGHRRLNTYSKLNEEKWQEREDEIERLKEELIEEQTRCDQLEESNESLTKQIKQLKQQLTQYIEDNNNAREIQYDQSTKETLNMTQLTILLQFKPDHSTKETLNMTQLTILLQLKPDQSTKETPNII